MVWVVLTTLGRSGWLEVEPAAEKVERCPDRAPLHHFFRVGRHGDSTGGSIQSLGCHAESQATR